MPASVLILLIIIGCQISWQKLGTQKMKLYRFVEIKKEEITDSVAEKEFIIPTELVFSPPTFKLRSERIFKEFIIPTELVFSPPTFKLRSERIFAELVVSNPTGKAVELVVNPHGGMIPYGGNTPFQMAVIPRPQIKYVGEIFPPEPALPMRLHFPRYSQTLFYAEIDLKNYQFNKPTTLEIEWFFHYFQDSGPRGIYLLKID